MQQKKFASILEDLHNLIKSYYQQPQSFSGLPPSDTPK